MVVSSSSVQSSPPQHQVFINFRGKQLRNGFVSHLEKALRKDGINVFIDKNETKGKDLSILFSRIEESRIALAIFSTLYTESNWCLNELEKIKECVDLGKLVVIPIFYKVETDDVKNLKGVFGDKFWELAKTCRGEKLDKWKEALEDVPKKLGFTLSEMSDEGEYISKIVGQVMKVLSDVSAGLERDVPIEDPSEADPDSSPLYGIETRLKQLEEKLEFDCESTLTVGVVGMPGIGKTTLTKMLYEKWQHKFLRCVFLHDVRKLWQDRMMDRNIFMRELLKDDDLSQQVAADLSPESLKALLLSKKSLVVLDNVTDKKQIEVLLGECDWIKKGSLIFITTSDKSVIEGKVDDTYEGAESVRGIFLDMSELKKKLPLEKCTFSGMRNLRYLKFYNSCCHRECEAGCKLSFPEGLEFPLDEATPKLKWVDLSHSSKLSKLSGLQNAESLQRVSLEGCKSLQELPREMNHMKSLVFLNMRGCTSLRFLPHMNLISMKTLILTNCSSLQEFRVISDNLETLKLDGTAISQLPANMVKLQRLMVLNLKDCIMLEAVPESLGKLKKLQELVLSGCSKLKTFPIPIENMKRLQILLLDTTAITDMPKILQFNSQIKCGMNGLSSLRHLCLSRNNMITNLQVNISQLHHLRLLDVKYCKNLTSIPLLPPNLEVLDAHGCEKLKTVATPLALLKLMEQVHSKFIFTNCNNLEQVAKNSITVYAQRKSQQDAGNVSEALLITSFPGSEVPSWFNHRTIGSSLKLKFPPHWCDNRLSTIVLCAVVSFPCTQDEINRFSIECTCEFTNELGTCVRFSCTLGGGWIEPREIDSDHVFIGYTSCSHLRNHVEGSGEHHKCVPTEASIEFEVRDGAGEIVNCGLSLVYEEPNHAVTEGDYNGTSSRRDFSVGESIVSFAVRFVSTVLKYLWLLVAFFLAWAFVIYDGLLLQQSTYNSR
ncbi:hypothetical protein HID58_000237, partial [Brassica napus]